MEHFVTMTRKQIAAWVLAIMVGTALVSITGAYFGFKAAAEATTVTVETSSKPVPSASPVVPVNDANAAELVPGTGMEKYRDDEEYRCKAGYSAVQVPTGQTKQVNGATYTLKEKGPKRESYDYQDGVTFTLKLPAGVSAPTLIVNTGAHQKAPTLYPQHLIQIALASGGSGNYELQSSAYADNYESIGITDITVCTKLSK